MEPKNKDPNLWKADDYDFLDYLDPDAVISSTDCTGLIPTPPRSEAEAEAYTDLHKIPRPTKKKNSK